MSYEVHTSDSGTPTALLTRVSTFIRQQLQSDFRGTWMLVAEWADAPFFGGNSATVSVHTRWCRPNFANEFGKPMQHSVLIIFEYNSTW